MKRISELNYPVETTDVLLTNLEYPPEITEKRRKIKMAELQHELNAAIAKANVAKSQRDAEIRSKQGAAKLVEANCKAACNKVRAKSLTPRVMLYKKLLMMKEFAKGQNNMDVVVPFTAIRPDLARASVSRAVPAETKPAETKAEKPEPVKTAADTAKG